MPEDGKIKNLQQLESKSLCCEAEVYPSRGSKGAAERGIGWCQGNVCFAGWLEKPHQVRWLEAEG